MAQDITSGSRSTELIRRLSLPTTLNESSAAAAALCIRCLSVLSGDTGPRYRRTMTLSDMRPHHLSPQDLADSVLQGCRICSAFICELTRETEQQSEIPWRAPYSSYVLDYDGLRIFGRYDKSFALTKAHFLEPAIRREDALDPILLAKLPKTTSTGDEQVLDLASYWLQSCLSGHKNCSIAVNTSWYPKRLLRLEEHSIRVVVSGVGEPHGPYATLSHCWGRGLELEMCMLTASNEAQFLQSIDFESLPQVFKDAVHITKSLGIRYLWIDSLCIMQRGEGSAEDWQEHTKKMKDVYRNGILNIAADAAASPFDECYVSREPSLVRAETQTWKGFDLQERAYDIYMDEFCGTNAIRSSTLSSRAWVVQERLFSPRILHMTNLQIMWECEDLPLACECRPRGIPLDARTYSGDHLPFSVKETNLYRSESRRIRDIDKHSEIDDEGRALWIQLLTHYTACALTFPEKDKFVAFSGVAELACALLKDEYAAGFMRSDILWDLTWWIRPKDLENGNAARVTESYQAPSWSWASINGPVQFHTATDRELIAQLNDVVVTHQDESNHYGMVSSAKLSIRSFLLPLTPYSQLVPWETAKMLWDFRDFDHLYDSQLRLFMDHPAQSIPDAGEVTLYLLAITHVKGDPGQHIPSSIQGLVILKQRGEVAHCRVGSFELHAWKATALKSIDYTGATTVAIVDIL